MENERIDKLEARILQLEKEVQQLKEEKNKPPILTNQEVPQPIKPVSTSIPKKPTVPKPETVKKEQTDWETLLGKVWLPRIFIFVLLLGVVWGFRIAVDAGWLNETNRIIIGFIVAVLFYYIGNKQIKRDRVALGKVLLVGFISTLLVTTFAMHILYDMIPLAVAFPLNVIWVAIGIYLSHLHRSQAMGVMFAVAGYLIPFLVAGSGTNATVVSVITYELIYYVALLWFAVRNQYRILFYVSTVFLHIVYIALLFTGSHVWDSAHIFLMTVGILIQHEVVFYTLLKGKIEKLRAFPVLFSGFIVTLTWAKIGFEIHDVAYLFTIYVLLTTIRYGWLAYHSNRKQQANLFSISTVAATFGISVLILDLVDSPYVSTSLFLIQGALVVYVGYTFQSKIQQIVGYVIYYLVALIIISDPFLLWWEDIMVWAILIGTLYFLVLFNLKRKDEMFFRVNIVAALLAHTIFLLELDYYNIAFGELYWMVIISSLIVLYRLTSKHMHTVMKQVYVGVNVIIHLAFISYLAGEWVTGMTNEVVFFTTIGWALYALGCVFIGVRRQHKETRLLGIGLILFTLLKLIFFDLAFISLATRAMLFVLLGFIGIVLSRFMYGKNKE
ncbi:DUF2339 domain-containing protein [Oceanobacillus luteolus]|uniref:DUF2339 domain-containing protein n=1 Tax=Oceanobacillus luteolus TaxID=1274358 RepID=UPI00203F51DD|nr:DUF2339 domain-containing protein [Oceanobacillus luteolus]MCM3741559.1 DUF2339 domain-containing protein [Oceanobacillus luteolus]